MPACFHCKRESSRAHYDRTVYNITPLYGPWSGWRMAGRVLVSPDGDRITPERLRGLMFRETNEVRRRKAKTKCGFQGVVVAGDFGHRAGHAPTLAGSDGI